MGCMVQAEQLSNDHPPGRLTKGHMAGVLPLSLSLYRFWDRNTIIVWDMMQVKKEDLDNKDILGQHETASSQFL